MDLSPYDQCRCDQKQCRLGRTCNLIALLVTIVFISGLAQAEMNLDRLQVDFRPDGKHHEDITVFNRDSKNLYVNVTVTEVINPGSKQEKRLEATDTQKISLIATPNRLIIPGGSQKAVRLVNLTETSEKERIYRVDFSPAVGQLKAKTNAIKILVAYQALVIVRPERPVAHVVAERKGKSVTFKNTGNTNVLLQSGTQCQPQKPSNCQDLKTKRLYAGNTWTLTLPFDGPLSYELDDGSKVERKTFGANTLKVTSK